MGNKVILLTGGTGFLGSHIAQRLIESGNRLLLTYRRQSNFSRCTDFKDKAIWISLDSKDWKSEVEKYKPTILINAAWQGVKANSRENWSLQIENLLFQQELLDLSASIHIKTFIGFGSQAEYGDIDYPIKETDPTNATTAYGAVKIAALQITKSFCEKYNIHWLWLRLFSFYGEGESSNWLIPFVIHSIKNNKPMDLTPGEQEVAYLYVKDLAEIIKKIIDTDIPSGVYNISGEELISLKLLITKIRNSINPEYKLTFGALPYRKNQPMKIIGSTEKLRTYISLIEHTDFDSALKNTVNYYLRKS